MIKKLRQAFSLRGFKYKDLRSKNLEAESAVGRQMRGSAHQVTMGMGKYKFEGGDKEYTVY